MWQIAAATLGGTCAVLGAPRLPSWIALGLATALLAVLGYRRRTAWPAALALGAVGASWQVDALVGDRLASSLQGEALRVRGTVVSVPQGELELLRFRFAPSDVLDAPAGMRLPRIVELTWYDAPSRVDAAEQLELVVKLRRPRGFSNPGGRDNEARLLRERIGATGYVRDGRRLGRSPRAAWRYPVLMLRARVADVVRDRLGRRPASGIVAGLAVGMQDAVDREQWRVLSLSGTSHLMAISGLHVTMIAALGAWLGALVQRWRQYRGARGARRDVAVTAGVCAALGYSLLAGWSVPTQRTMVMLAVAAVALRLRRRTGIGDGLGLCACCVLILDPLAPLAPGFWLSFGAVAALLHGTTGFVRSPSIARSYLRTQAAVTVGLAPVLGASFGAVSLVSMCVNLYAIPLYTLVIVPAVLVSCAMALAAPGVGGELLDATAWLIEATWPMLAVPAAWPLASWPVAGLDPIAWLALVVGAIAVLSPLPPLGRCAGGVLVVAGCLWHPPPVAPGVARVTVLDVGQGLAVVVQTRRHALLYDAGPLFRSGSDAGQLVVVPFLHHRGIRRLDVVVASHDDDDHKGGIASVLDQVPAQTLVSGPGVRLDPPPGRALEPARMACRRGGHWRWDGVEFDWLHPGVGPYPKDNDGSCVLRIRAGATTALVTGDVESVAEREMLEVGVLETVDVLVVPHHGSRTSSSPSFVATTRPRWAVHSVGHRNRWNFPAPAVVQRWRDAGARQRRTSSSGAISFELHPGRAVAPPEEWRRARPRPWREP